MPKENINLRNELRNFKFEYNLLQKIPCSKQENKTYQQTLSEGGSLPGGVFAYVYENGETSTTEFYTVYESDFSESEIKEYLTYKKLSFIKTIRNCVLFFTILTIIGMVAYFMLLMNAY